MAVDISTLKVGEILTTANGSKVKVIEVPVRGFNGRLEFVSVVYARDDGKGWNSKPYTLNPRNMGRVAGDSPPPKQRGVKAPPPPSWEGRSPEEEDEEEEVGENAKGLVFSRGIYGTVTLSDSRGAVLARAAPNVWREIYHAYFGESPQKPQAPEKADEGQEDRVRELQDELDRLKAKLVEYALQDAIFAGGEE